MRLFNLGQKEKLESIKELPFKLEKEIQKISESNLEIIFGLHFVKSEFSLNDFRIDTLAFEKETQSFVVIEYKRDKNFSVIDQGYAYLSLMLNNKADFILEYNENCQDSLKKADVDWSQSKVVFISPSFTPYQREAINFKDLPIELWEIKRYSNDSIIYNQIKTSGAQESIKTISKQDETIEKVSKEIKVYTEQELLGKANDTVLELYERFKNAVLSLDNIEIKPTKLYVAFVGSSNIVDVEIQRNRLKIWINLAKGELDDPKNLARDVSNVGHWGNGAYEIKIENDENLEYIMSLIKQSLKKNKR